MKSSAGIALLRSQYEDSRIRYYATGEAVSRARSVHHITPKQFNKLRDEYESAKKKYHSLGDKLARITK